MEVDSGGVGLISTLMVLCELSRSGSSRLSYRGRVCRGQPLGGRPSPVSAKRLIEWQRVIQPLPASVAKQPVGCERCCYARWLQHSRVLALHLSITRPPWVQVPMTRLRRPDTVPRPVSVSAARQCRW